MSEENGSGAPRAAGPPATKAGRDQFKEFATTSLAIDHSTSVMVLLFIITVMGIISYINTPKESFPEIEIPMISVSTIYPGVSPADMESLVTRPLEDELSTISDIKELTSSSVEGFSTVIAEFETTMDIEEALQRVRERVDLARPKLPSEAEDPAITEFNMTEVPIMQVNLSGEYGLVRLKEIAEELQDELETIPQILRVDVRGGLEREVAVEVNLTRLQYYGLAISDVVETIQDENVNIPGGSIDVGTAKYLVRVDGEFNDPAIIGDLVVASYQGAPVYVRDVASVDFGFADRSSFARLDGTDVVTLDIVKRSGRNIIQTSDAVKRILDDVVPTLPPTTVAKITSDQSTDIRMMVSSLENNIVSALILIVGVLLFFLGLANSGFVAVSIPASMLLSFIVLNLMGSTMNMIVLFSLILALGMLVDNAIVIVENIYRYMEEGWDRVTAAKKATGEVAVPVIAATATTLAAFAPLLFWPGTTGDFMSYLPRTLIITLTSSLFVALVMVPTLCAMYMRLESEPAPPLRPAARYTMMGVGALVVLGMAVTNPLTAGLLVLTALIIWAGYRYVLHGFADRFQASWVPAMQNSYERSLRWALDHRAIILAGTAASFVGTIMLYTVAGQGLEYFPEDIPPKEVFVDLELPVGSRVEETNRLLKRLEEELLEVPGRSDWKSSVAVAGGGGGENGASGMMGQGGPSGPDRGRVSLSFVDFQDQVNDPFETLGWLQEHIGAEIAGAEITVEKLQEGAPTGSPVNIEIVGEDPLVLKQLSDEALRVLRAAPVFNRLVGLESDLNSARPELAITVDRELASLYDLSTSDVGRAVRGAIQGVEAAKYRTGDDEYDIIVRLAPEFRQELDQLADLTVMAEGGIQIPLNSVASWKVGEGYGTIRRKDQERVATLSSDVGAGLNQNAILQEVQGTLAGFEADLPTGYSLAYTGAQEEQAEAQAFLINAFLLAIFAIGLILVSQFNSVIKPVIILTSVLMSTVGVLLGLMIFKMPFVVIMTGIGIISLAGIVVNNAIVLIDYIDILRERDGMNRREALVHGGRTRFRPVVLTATTTALGLVPLAIGLNFDFFGLYSSLEPELFWGGDQAAWWGPMAIAVIAGIIFATFLTLILVPVMYSLIDDFTHFFEKWYKHHPGDEEEDAAIFGGRVPPTVATREPAEVFRSGVPPLGGPQLSPES